MPAEANYYTPEGCVDLPFQYTFDGASLTDATNPPIQIVPIEWDSDFILRAILGVPSCIAATGGFLLYNNSGSQAFGGPYSPFTNHYAVVPEKIYPANGAIRFALSNVLRQNKACATTIYDAQIAFQGVKRYRPGTPGYQVGAPAFPAPYDPSKFTTKPWTYPLALNLSWFKWTNPAASGIADIPRTFTVEVQDYDFELHYIAVSNATTGAKLQTQLFRMTLYDATAKRALSTAPVAQRYWNEKGGMQAVFPVPPLVYPVWTQIRVDVQSQVCNTDPSAPYSLQIAFVGVRRIPKVGA